MIVRLLILLAVGIVCSSAIAAETYRWEDDKGRVYYSDQPPPPGARNVRRTRKYDDAEERSLPYRLQVVVQQSPVTLYLTDCGEPCDRARELLIDRGVPHTLLDASEADVQEELVALTNGRLEVPVVSVGKVVLRGFEENQWNSVLDVAGYPSYAMIEIKPYTPEPTEQPATQDTGDGEVLAGDTDEYDTADAESSGDELDESFVEDADTGDADAELVEQNE